MSTSADLPTEGAVDTATAASDLGVDLPDDHESAVGVLLDALGTARASADGYLDDLRRVAADYENFRKRAERDRQDLTERATQRLIESLLPVLDSFEQALAVEGGDDDGFRAGMRKTHEQLLDVLAKEGLERVEAAGQPFDPEVHEAISGITDGNGRLMVANELRAGYTLAGRLLRPAMVIVDVDDE